MGYKLSQVAITDSKVIKTSGEAMHPILNYTGKAEDQVTGMVFDISTEELAHADAYEVADYKRVLGKLKSGGKAWVYVSAS